MGELGVYRLFVRTSGPIPRARAPGRYLRPTAADAETAKKTLTSYGWVDAKAGIVRIPIERAMDLVIEPRRPQGQRAEVRGRAERLRRRHVRRSQGGSGPQGGTGCGSRPRNRSPSCNAGGDQAPGEGSKASEILPRGPTGLGDCCCSAAACWCWRPAPRPARAEEQDETTGMMGAWGSTRTSTPRSRST